MNPTPTWAELPHARLSERALFYRDPELFQQLREAVFPHLRGRAEAPIRVWLVDCGTGEDAYALAIELLALLGGAPLRIFATDLAQELVDFARAGTYEEGAFLHLGEAAREAYFRPLGGLHRAAESVRRCCVFAKLDLLSDPPLGRMDVVVYCGQLSALAPAHRTRALSSLHYALHHHGFLVLGQGEHLEHEALSPLDGAPRVHVRGTPLASLRLVSREPELQPRLQAPLAPPTSSRQVADLREHLAEIGSANAGASQQLAALNDELAAMNEELSASNEDLRCLNEELRVAREQLLSNNQELNELNGKLAAQNRDLHQLNSDLVNVFTTAEMPVVILDASARIRRFSSFAHKLVRVLDSDIGRPFEDLRLQLEVPGMRAALSEVIAGGEAREWEVRDREGRWHRLAIRPYRGPDDNLDGVVISLFDIDDLKRSARRAEQASQEAERASRAKDEFMAILSHELRSPLHSVLVYAQLLKRDALRGEKLQHAVDPIENGVSLLVQLLDELLDVSRIVSGKFQLRKRPVDLAELVSRALEAVAEELADRQLQLRADLPALLPVSGDALRLQQVVANLLSNAIKFTPRGGSIAVSLGELGEQARLCVHDDGIGIDPEFLPRVFDRFTQGDSTLAREYGGLGLGLHIVRQIVDLHGGEVAAASDGVGKGAQFTVSVPVSCEVACEPVPVLTMPTGLLDGLRILVVDDDRVARAAVGEVLSHAGAEVLSAPSAADGFEAVLECEPQLILCDIAMPGEDGYSLIKRVRALEDPALSRIPALALTALARESDRERALAAGYQEHMAKPVDVDLLMQALATLRAGSSVR